MRRKGSLVALLGVLMALLLATHAQAQETPEGASDGQPIYQSISELEGHTVGVATGTVFDQLVAAGGYDITEFSYYSSYSDMVGALKAGRVDAFMCDEPNGKLLVSRNEGIALLPEPLTKDDYGYVLAKGSPLTPKISSVIDDLRADGTLDALAQEWLSADEEAKQLPEQDWDTPNGTLRIGIDSANEPMSYIRDGEIVGYDMELVLLVARELGMGVEAQDMPFDGLLPAVQAGKVDMGVSSTSITEERKKSMDFTSPTYYGSAVFVVPAEQSASNVSFFEGLAASFERTFITESRWKLILQGLGVTLAITVCSGAIGTALGYVTMLLRRKGNHVADAFVGGFEGLMGRLPIVVVLMVFYYVIFGSIDLPGVVVATVVFSLSFGASAGAIMWNAVRAVDVGQSEASLALGFNDRETFRKVILPQAAQQFLPLLQGQLVSLVKDTAVVGYIAVQDLTRSSDLIRSRTMEAFFPLISTAAIYFVLCSLLAAAVGVITHRMDLDRRPRTIKGVEL